MKRIMRPLNDRQMIAVTTVIFSVLFLFWGHRIAANNLSLFNGQNRATMVTARVLDILDSSVGEEEQIDVGSVEPVQVRFEAKIIKGEGKGITVEALQQNGGYSPKYLKQVAAGDKVLLSRVESDLGGVQWMMQEFVRTDTLVVLGLAFAGFLLLFGRGKGLNTIISLTFTCLAVFLVFIPAILSGRNVYLTTIIVSLFIIATSLLLVIGPNHKSLAAGVGCLGGLAVSGLLTLLMDVFLKLTGIVDEESLYLLSINPDHPLDLKAIIFASIVIGALGATLDVSVSISSSLHEIRQSAGKAGFGEIIRSGMAIGRDIMGTMANTLILAYIGGSMSMTILLIVYNNSLLELLNREAVVVEILHALAGSFGLLFAIPLTSIASAVICCGWRIPIRRIL